jgi:hypothetical protein
VVYHFLPKGPAFGIGLHEPGRSGVCIREDLEVIVVTDLLARVPFPLSLSPIVVGIA